MVGALIWFLFETRFGDWLCWFIETTQGQAMSWDGHRLTLVSLQEIK